MRGRRVPANKPCANPEFRYDYNVPFVWKTAGKLLGVLLLVAFALYAVFHGL